MYLNLTSNQSNIFFRFDRVFLPYPGKDANLSQEQHKQACQVTRSARMHLRYLCDKALQKHDIPLLEPAVEKGVTDFLLSVIKARKQEKQERKEQFVLAFIHRLLGATQSMAKLLHLLSCDAPISSVVPFRYHKHLQKYL